MRRSWRICRVFGHDRESYRDGHYYDGRGRWRARMRTRCKRCGAGGPACWEPTVFERAADAWREWRWLLARWRPGTCSVCGKPTTRWGRPVGDHWHCQEIPF